jgi:hypothetical protein
MFVGIDLRINGGLVIQSDEQRPEKFHFGYVSGNQVKWLDFGEQSVPIATRSD